ncbi:MAG: type I DNA topoisomerase, partial [Kiritimatiellae bacterium]|nr:type I DNA topoisomerase [Kiritimatiellia bacterium]
MNTLVVVESPAKAHTVGRILGPGYTVLPSVGHVRDLPTHKLGIDISADGRSFAPQYEIPPEKHRVVDDLVKAAKKADEILLASDPDREGEAIAWHIREILSQALAKSGAKKRFARVEYNEITPGAVRAAVAHPHDVDMDRVNAQQARRLLDRLVGWKISPSLRRADLPAAQSRGLSAGRVQSVALRMVCEREAEIRAFKPEPYWLFSVPLSKREEPKTPFETKLREFRGEALPLRDAAAAGAAAKFLAAAQYSVESVKTGRKKRNPGPPFTTSTLQQAASTALGFSPDVTMRLAQTLYESSLITYMRTDSQAVSADARAAAGEFIRSAWGAEFANPHTYANRAGAQAAHECIRPTDPALVPDAVAPKIAASRDSDRAAKLYALIWRRFVSSQMAPAVYETLEVSVAARDAAAAAGSAPEARLGASTSRLAFPGFLRADGASIRDDGYDPNAARKKDSDDDREGDDDANDAVASLPPLSEGETLDLADAPRTDAKETKPKPRYNEASLVKALEKNGIGRPSTFATVIATLKNRKYVSSERRVLAPTELGEKVNGFLVPHFPELLDVGFTASMEKKLDEVEDPAKKLDWQEMLADFHARLKSWLEQSRGPAADPEAVRATLAAFLRIGKWNEPRVAAGKRYSDLDFVQGVADDFMGVPRPSSRKSRREGAPVPPPANAAGYAFDPARGPAREFSSRLLRSLVSVLLRYRDQVPDALETARAAGFPELAEDERALPPSANTVHIVDILSACGVEPRSENFFGSLAAQVKSGKRLSPKQEHWLGEIFLEARDRVPGFSPALCEELGVKWKEPPAPVDREKIETLLSG